MGGTSRRQLMSKKPGRSIKGKHAEKHARADAKLGGPTIPTTRH